MEGHGDPAHRERTSYRGTTWYVVSSTLTIPAMSDDLEIAKNTNNEPVATMRRAVIRLQFGRFILSLDRVTEQYVGVAQIDGGLKKIFGRKNDAN